VQDLRDDVLPMGSKGVALRAPLMQMLKRVRDIVASLRNGCDQETAVALNGSKLFERPALRFREEGATEEFCFWRGELFSRESGRTFPPFA
jgi:hypothetical protein